ncbi:MAG: energy-coupling factor transporter ATPase [Peptococcaceae bacterium]|nr:energy-coupling factor transporter ATPase [Peptococcaceae bacterium]
MKEGQALIDVNNVVHIYNADSDSEILALDHVNLHIEQGEHIAILGRNGCGKSTLAKHLNGLLLPTEGRVSVDDFDTLDADHSLDILQRVGMVFQNPDNQLVATTVLEEIAFGPENLGLPREKILERVDEALKMVQMEDFRNAMPHHLSGGQKQRIAIAGIIAMRPETIVFDEPTAMLDPDGREEVVSTMLRLNKEEGLTIVNITHFMEEAVLADRVVVMDDGKIVMEGTPREIFTHVDELRALHLDVPAVTEIAVQLHEEFPFIPRDVLTIEEMVKVLCP